MDLASYANQYATVGATNYNSANTSMNCQDNTSSSPSSGSGSGSGNSKDDMNTASNSTNQDCTTNPSGPGCSQTTAATYEKNAAATAAVNGGLSTGTANVNDTSGLTSQPSFGGGGDPSQNQGPQVHTIANNTGGGIPGGAGGGGGITGGNQGGGLFGALASTLTNIEQGLRSGGYSSPAGQAEEEKPDPANGFSGYANGRDPALAGGVNGLDLKRYLPGGSLDPARAAAMSMQALGILPKHVDLWSRITEKMREKCKLGELLDCA